MKWLLYVIVLIWIGGGTCLILYTRQCRVFFKKTFSRVDRSLLAIMPITFGAILVAGAYQSSAFWFMIILGILAIGKGCFLIFNPAQLAEKLCRWFFEEASDETYRLAGLIAAILGTALVSWI